MINTVLFPSYLYTFPLFNVIFLYIHEEKEYIKAFVLSIKHLNSRKLLFHSRLAAIKLNVTTFDIAWVHKMTYPPLILVFCMLAEQSLSQDYSLQFLQTYSKISNLDLHPAISKLILLLLDELNGACRTAKDCRPFGYICKNNKTCDCSEMYRPDVYKKQCVGGELI